MNLTDRLFRGGVRARPWIGPRLPAYAVAAALGAVGYVVNLHPVDFAFGTGFALGAVFAFASVRTCGTGPAILAGIVSSVALYQVWDHPAAAVAYALNIAFGAWVFARRPTIPQLAEAAYWPVVGGPLMWGVYR